MAFLSLRWRDLKQSRRSEVRGLPRAPRFEGLRDPSRIRAGYFVFSSYHGESVLISRSPRSFLMIVCAIMGLMLPNDCPLTNLVSVVVSMRFTYGSSAFSFRVPIQCRTTIACFSRSNGTCIDIETQNFAPPSPKPFWTTIQIRDVTPTSRPHDMRNRLERIPRSPR